MDRSRRRKSVSNGRKDIMSQLPLDVKDKILGCLSTRDAARSALLSTEWKDVWLRHGRLVFDNNFFFIYIKRWGRLGFKRALRRINVILMGRAGPVKKFTLSYSHADFMLPQSDIDKWCLFLSGNGIEELNISVVDSGTKYELPDCILSCPTIKRLKLEGVLFGCQVNARIFPNLTLLCFKDAQFKCNGKGNVCNIPNLERLAFEGSCKGINSFEIGAPKLERLSAIDLVYVFQSKWFTVHLKTIKTLCMSGLLLSRKPVAKAIPTFPTAINLQVMKLYELSFRCGMQLTVAMQLLQKCPNLCELDIMAEKSSGRDDKEAASRLLEDPDNCFIIQDMKMLNTVKIESFCGSTLEMLFVKSLLSKSPELEKVVIEKGHFDNNTLASEILRELLSFPRASPKAQLLIMEQRWMYTLIGSPELVELQ